MQKLKNLEFYIPLIISTYLILAFRFKMFTMPLGYSETDFLMQNIFSKNGLDLQLFAHKIPNIPALIYYLLFTIFGNNIIVIRAIVSIFSIICIFVIFKFGNFFFGKQAGIFAATILIIQNIFLAQFANLKPEIINCTLLIAALYCFLREKYRTMSIWLLLSVNIDISCFLATLFLLIAFLIKRNYEQKSQSIIFFLIPLLLFATVEIINLVVYNQLSVLKSIDTDIFVNQLFNKANFVFVLQQRLCITLFFVIAIITAAIQHQIKKYEIKNYVYSTIFIVVIIMGQSVVSVDNCTMITAVAMLAIITGAAFSVINLFYIHKYIVISIVIIMFAVFAARNYNTSCEYISHTHQIETDKYAVEYITNNILPKDSIMCSKFFYNILSNKYLGYVNKAYNAIDTVYAPQKYIYIVKRCEADNKLINATLLEDKCFNEKSFYKGKALTDIYTLESSKK